MRDDLNMRRYRLEALDRFDDATDEGREYIKVSFSGDWLDKGLKRVYSAVGSPCISVSSGYRSLESGGEISWVCLHAHLSHAPSPQQNIAE